MAKSFKSTDQFNIAALMYESVRPLDIDQDLGGYGDDGFDNDFEDDFDNEIEFEIDNPADDIEIIEPDTDNGMDEEVLKDLNLLAKYTDKVKSKGSHDFKASCIAKIALATQYMREVWEDVDDEVDFANTGKDDISL